MVFKIDPIYMHKMYVYYTYCMDWNYICITKIEMQINKLMTTSSHFESVVVSKSKWVKKIMTCFILSQFVNFSCPALFYFWIAKLNAELLSYFTLNFEIFKHLTSLFLVSILRQKLNIKYGNKSNKIKEKRLRQS